MNVRHISHFSEFQLSVVPAAGLFSFALWKNLHSINLNKSKKYKIENLSLDIGSTEYESKDISFDGLAFPLRFFLDNDPLNSEYERLKINAFYGVSYNGVGVPAPNSLKLPQANDILDSSNSYFNGGIYYNLFLGTAVLATPALEYQKRKTNTIAEYNFFNFSQCKITESSTNYFTAIISNNDSNNFYFDSKNFEYLNFSIYPLLRFTTSTPSTVNFLITLNFTINFDLIEY